MERIVCKGKLFDDEKEVVCTRENHAAQWDITVDGRYSKQLTKWLIELYRSGIAFGGTYRPDDKKSAYYMMSAVQELFENRGVFTVVEVDEEMESEKGVIY